VAEPPVVATITSTAASAPDGATAVMAVSGVTVKLAAVPPKVTGIVAVTRCRWSKRRCPGGLPARRRQAGDRGRVHVGAPEVGPRPGLMDMGYSSSDFLLSAHMT
jgi:hypothetical protein